VYLILEGARWPDRDDGSLIHRGVLAAGLSHRRSGILVLVPQLSDDVLFPFCGRVVWLTGEQNGRGSGPPCADDKVDYAANAFVPPQTAQSGLASFVLRNLTSGVAVSMAEGRWLVVENAGPYQIESGTVVVISEGPKPVGYFHVEDIRND
jgi:hypothetical protein